MSFALVFTCSAAASKRAVERRPRIAFAMASGEASTHYFWLIAGVQHGQAEARAWRR